MVGPELVNAERVFIAQIASEFFTLIADRESGTNLIVTVWSAAR